MHNGGIAEFPRIKRRLQKDLPDVAFDMVQGNTDSEWAFALFLSKVRLNLDTQRLRFTLASS